MGQFKNKIFSLLTILSLSFIAQAHDMESTPSIKEIESTPIHIEFKSYGFYSVIDYTFMTNINKGTFDDQYGLNGLTAIAGFQWRTGAAAGLGFSYLNDANKSFSQIPIFIEFRSHFLRSRVSPYTAIQAGYSIPFGSVNSNTEYIKIDKGGLTIGLEIGARIALRRKFAVNVFAGYQAFSLTMERGINSVNTNRAPELYHNIKGGFGICF